MEKLGRPAATPHTLNLLVSAYGAPTSTKLIGGFRLISAHLPLRETISAYLFSGCRGAEGDDGRGNDYRPAPTTHPAPTVTTNDHSSSKLLPNSQSITT